MRILPELFILIIIERRISLVSRISRLILDHSSVVRLAIVYRRFVLLIIILLLVIIRGSHRRSLILRIRWRHFIVVNISLLQLHFLLILIHFKVFVIYYSLLVEGIVWVVNIFSWWLILGVFGVALIDLHGPVKLIVLIKETAIFLIIHWYILKDLRVL